MEQDELLVSLFIIYHKFILMTKKQRSSNDQRSDVHNPQSPEYKASADNKTNQMNPNHPSYSKSRGK